MKKLLFSTLLLLVAYTGKAQSEDGGSDFKLGLTVHPTMGWIRSDVSDTKSDGMKFGFSYGLLGDFLFKENYAFSTGLKLTSINGKTEEKINTVTNNKSYKLQYIEIPAKLKLLTNENGEGIRFYGEFGLGNAFNVRARQDVKSNDPSQVKDNDNINKRTTFYRGSIILGAGAEILISGKTKVQTGITFDNGFTNIQKGGGALKSSYLGINLGVYF